MQFPGIPYVGVARAGGATRRATDTGIGPPILTQVKIERRLSPCFPERPSQRIARGPVPGGGWAGMCTSSPACDVQSPIGSSVLTGHTCYTSDAWLPQSRTSSGARSRPPQGMFWLVVASPAVQQMLRYWRTSVFA